MPRPRRADPFRVWGKPPPLLRTLTKRQQDSLRRYIRRVAGRVYRIAYDCGKDAASKQVLMGRQWASILVWGDSEDFPLGGLPCTTADAGARARVQSP